MSDRPAPSRGVAAGTLFLARVVYAFNWYNIGAVLPLVGRALGAGHIELGIVLAAFLVGAGIFQVPAGLAALRWGSRRVSLAALLVMGAFSLASAFSPDWQVLAGLRFGAGAGAALFFAPALGLVAAYFPPGSRGPVIGFYNAGFSVGSAGGLFLGALVGEAWGWPWALALGGVALLAVAAIAPALLPPSGAPPAPRPPRVLWASALPVLRSRALWGLALGIAGLWAAFYVAAQYFVEFASQAHAGWGLTVAAAVPTVMIVTEVLGGPIGGWLGERFRDMRRILLFWGVGAGVGVALVPFLTLATAWPMFAFLGFANGVVFAVLYLLPSYLPGMDGENFALGLALLNSIQIFVGSGFAIAFAVVVAGAGYWIAWVFAGALAVAFLPFLAAVPAVVPPRAVGRPAGSSAAPGYR